MSPRSYVTDTYPAMAWCIFLALCKALKLHLDSSLFTQMRCSFCSWLNRWANVLVFERLGEEVLAHPDTYLSWPTSRVPKCLLAFCVLPKEGRWPSSYAVRYPHTAFKVQLATCLICLRFTERCSLSWCLTRKETGTELIGQELPGAAWRQ